MMFVQFEGKQGDKIYVNPERIKYIMGDAMGSTSIGFEGSAIYVKGCPDEIIGKIERCMHQHIVTAG